MPTDPTGEASAAGPPAAEAAAAEAALDARRAELRAALTDVLHEQRAWLVDVLREALDEDAAEQARLATEARAVLDDPRVAFPPVRGRA